MAEFVRQSVLIYRPVAEVFAYVSNFENYPKYFPGVGQMRAASSGPIAPGKIYHEVARVPLLGQQSITVEVKECVPDERIAIESDLPVLLPRFEYLFRAVTHGSTEMTYAGWSRQQVAALRWIAGLATGVVLRRRARRGLWNLKRILEKA